MTENHNHSQQPSLFRESPFFRSFLLGMFWLWAASCAWLAYYQPPLLLTQMLVFVRLVVQQDLPALWVTGVVLVLALLLLPRWRDEHVERLLCFIDKNIVFLCFGCFIFFAVLAAVVYGCQPMATDEYCIVLQSRIFAAGQLSGRVSPELLDFVAYKPFQSRFYTVNHTTGQWMATYWPGTAMLMTPFTLLGAPWLFNPAVSALTIFFLHRLAKQWSESRSLPGWVVLFAFASPVIAINAAGFYSMPSHMLMNVLFCLFLTQNTRREAFIAGLIGGFALILHNPLPHLAFALPWFLFLAFKRRHLLMSLLSGYLIFGFTLGLGWIYCLTAVSGVQDGQAGQSSNGILASLPRILALPTIGFLESRISGLVKLMLWASPGLLILCFAAWKRDFKNSIMRVLGFSLIITFIAYLAVRFDQGHGWGFRYLHSAWFALPVLGAAFVSSEIRKPPLKADMNNMGRYVSLCALLGLCLVTPCYIVTARIFILQQRAQIPEPPPGRAIIFINTQDGYYIQDLAQNDPFLRDSVWRLISQNERANAKIARKYLPEARRVDAGRWGEMWVEVLPTPKS